MPGWLISVGIAEDFFPRYRGFEPNTGQLFSWKAFSLYNEVVKKGKRKVQGVLQSQTAALSRHQEEEETDKTKQAQIEQTYEKH